MTVPKSKRHKSRFEVFHNMQALQKELVKHLMQDFGITRIADLGEAQFLDLKFERVINLCAEIVGDIHRANAMYVSNMLEYEERRLYQDKAIGNCVVLKQELQSIIDIISGLNLNKYKTSIELKLRYKLTETGHLVIKINPKSITRERRKLKKYRKMVDQGKIPLIDVQNSFKSWLGTYDKLLSYRSKSNMIALYNSLFKEHF